MTQDSATQGNRAAILTGLSAYFWWGMMPFFFKQLQSVAPFLIVSHRVLWSTAFMLGIVAVKRDLVALVANVQKPRILLAMATSALLIFSNWCIYIWAAINGHILAASLGYFFNPMVNVALGVIFLKERLRPLQWLAVAFALVSVGIMALGAGHSSWISLVLGLSFGFYGLVRKTAPVGPIQGLTIETCILVPLAVIGLFVFSGPDQPLFGPTPSTMVFLVMTGIMTSMPLLLFATAARKLSLTTLGLMQYIAPGMQFVIAWAFYGEKLTPAMMASFALIWVGLAIFTWDGLRNRRA